ncbi:histone-fold-containing protein, partial [Baffinella frigidus]
AGLLFPVAQAGAFATLMSGMVVEGSAAIFLAAVLEYMTAEIMTLSGNVCRDLDKTAVEPRHILLGIGGDAELD